MRNPRFAALFAELDALLPPEPEAITETRLKAMPDCTQADHEHAKRPSQFPKLIPVGTWELEGEALEMANCPRCHSTLCRKVAR